MLVYGDHPRQADPRELLTDIRKRIETLEQPELAIERHGRRVAAFIAAAELAQALADAAAEQAGGDGPSLQEDAALALLMPLAEAVIASWRALGENADPRPLDRARIETALVTLEALQLPARVQPKTGEGYAYYALYPEAYAEAALRAGLGMQTTVVGVRSIGLGLAAMVAAACGAQPPLSVRPIGHPFNRELRLTSEMAGRLDAAAADPVAIVDEGPGLSGSSFGAVADALEVRGAQPERLVFLPSHAGEVGPQASEHHRARWAASRRVCIDFDALVLRAEHPGHRLASWFADIVGADAEQRDISGGGWRDIHCAGRPWPAVNTFQERRKVLLTGGGERLLLKFVGLGAIGERAFEAERRLADAGFTPEPLALRHGFTGRRWLQAAPLRLDDVERSAFAAHLGRYLGWRAAHLAPPGAGAGPSDILQMARVNAVAALGGGASQAPALDPARWADLPAFRPVWTDNRLHRHEWLATPDGRWLKADAIDHAQAHDLVGPQDVAWDVAGASVEFGLTTSERTNLMAALAQSAPIEPVLATALEPAYAAFQFAAHAMAAAAHSHWPEEQARLTREADRYRVALRRRLA